MGDNKDLRALIERAVAEALDTQLATLRQSVAQAVLAELEPVVAAAPAPDFGYTAAKAALIAHAKKLALMHAAQGVRVNAIAPGSTLFPGGVWSMVREQQPEMYEAVRGSIPSGRLGTPEEIANVAVFLVSPRAGWVAGECVSVDGGQHRGMR